MTGVEMKGAKANGAAIVGCVPNLREAPEAPAEASAGASGASPAPRPRKPASAAPGAMPWLASYPAGIDWAAPISEQPLPEALDDIVARHGARPCLDFFGKITSYGELGALVDRAAKGFQDLGVGRGDRVGLLLPNCPYFVICYYAILKAGGTVVNFNPLYVQEQIDRQISDSGTRIMVTLDLKALLSKASAALAETCLERVVVCSLVRALPFPKNVLFPLFKARERAPMPKDGRHLAYGDLIANDGRYAPVTLRPRQDVAVLQYTGGTTGRPKGAMLTHANVAANARQLSLWNAEGREGAESTVAVLPFFHVFAMTVVMNQAILHAATMILMPRFDLEALLKIIHKKRPTVLAGVPTIYNALHNHPDIDRFDLSSLKRCVSGGAALPAEVRREFEARTNRKLLEGYGLTEASPTVTSNPLTGAGKPGSIGLPLPGTRVEIHDLERPGRQLPPGEKGEICVRGPQVMAGYWNRPAETAETLVDGLLRTGDVGYMDSDGYVFLVDRIKDVMICSGFNVYPRVVEEAIYRNDAVAEVTVIGVADDYRGEAPKAFVRLRQGAVLSAEALREFLADKLARFEMPREIEFRDELPKTMIGKLSKKELVEEEHAKAATDSPGRG